MVFILHFLLFSSTVVEALLRISDVHDQQVIGFRRRVSHKLKRWGSVQIILSVSVELRRTLIYSKDERRLVLMRAVPVPHYVYSTWYFTVTVQSDVVSWSDGHLQHRFRSPIRTAGRNSWNTSTTVKADWDVLSVTRFHITAGAGSCSTQQQWEGVSELLSSKHQKIVSKELPKRASREMSSPSMCDDESDGWKTVKQISLKDIMPSAPFFRQRKYTMWLASQVEHFLLWLFSIGVKVCGSLIQEETLEYRRAIPSVLPF